MSGKQRSVWSPILPVPENAPAAKISHDTRGEPLRVFVYRDADEQLLGYTCRFLTSSGDALHLPLTWCHDQDGMRAWRWIQFQRLRPLYGLDRLAKCDEVDNVLIVFDEHAAEYARQLVPWLTVVSWPGGIRKIDDVDISPLRGRTIWIWPTLTRDRAKPRRGFDASASLLLPKERQSGWQAALKLEKILIGYGCSIVGIVDPFTDETRPEGWDVGMAGTQNWTAEQLDEWMTGHMANGLGSEVQQRIRKLKGDPAPGEAPLPPETAPPPSGAGAGQSWESRLVMKHGDLAICTANVADILLNRKEWKGVLGYDDFEKKTVKLKPPPFYGGEVGDWDESDDTWTSMWMARTYGFTPSSQIVAESVEAIAKKVFKFNPVQDYLNSHTWDGVSRLDLWLTQYLGVEESEYSMLVGRYFFIALIDRAMNPGGQFKYCLILEGLQDAGKSKALRIIGGHWYGDTDIDLHNKDSMVGIQGKWLYEFPEMDSVSRAEASKTKSFLSRQIDEFRPHYGRRIVKFKRQTVFSGSVNEFEYLKDPSGAVRFWPVLCGEIDHDGLTAVRDQLFAEAFVRWKAKERFFPTKEQQKDLFNEQQIERQQQESFVDVIHDWVYARRAPFTIADVILDCMKLDASKMTKDVQTRVGQSLRKLGCRRTERRNGMIRYWYEPPTRNEAESKAGQPAQGWEDAHVPF